MEIASLFSLEGFTDIGLRGGVDMRPTLLRVLTDLYVQKPKHTVDEERHYTELAMRLLDSVDVSTRAATAARLARYVSPPRRVIERLAVDLPEVAAQLRAKVRAEDSGTTAAATRGFSVPPARKRAQFAPPASAISPRVAAELNELFFAANAEERRLILLNLDIAVALPPRRTGIRREPAVGQRLEAAALARRHDEFIQELARSLSMSREQAQRIVRDELGEPIVVAAKALSIPRDLFYRILLFVNTAVGHSVERVHALAELYDRVSVRAADDLVAVWQALKFEQRERAAPSHQRLGLGQERAARAAPAVRRAPVVLPKPERRDAS